MSVGDWVSVWGGGDQKACGVEWLHRIIRKGWVGRASGRASGGLAVPAAGVKVVGWEAGVGMKSRVWECEWEGGGCRGRRTALDYI